MKQEKAFSERLALEGKVATRLRHTHRNPAEWIGELRDGSRIHIASDKTGLRIAKGADLNSALVNAKANNITRVLHQHISREVPTDKMLEVTGLSLAAGVEVNSIVPGDLV